MKRYITVNNSEKLERFDYETPKQIVGKYVVDDSNFVPTSEAIRQLGNGGVSKDIQNGFYDFPAGNDNGKPVPFSRTRECNDIAVLSSRISEDTEIMSETIKENQEHKAKIEKFEADMMAARESSKTSLNAKSE